MTVGELKKKLQGLDDKLSIQIYYKNDEGVALILDATDVERQKGTAGRGRDGRPFFRVNPKGKSQFVFIDAVDDIES